MRKTIRKNAFKHIASLMKNASGVILRNSTSDNYVGYDFVYSVSGAAEALTWLTENQDVAQVFIDNDDGVETLVIRGPNHFHHVYTVYFSAEDFQRSKAVDIDRWQSPELVEKNDDKPGYSLRNNEDDGVLYFSVVKHKNKFTISSFAEMNGERSAPRITSDLEFTKPAAAGKAIECCIDLNPLINAPSNLSVMH